MFVRCRIIATSLLCVLLCCVVEPLDAQLPDPNAIENNSDFYNVGGTSAIRKEIIQSPIHKKGLNLDQIASCQVVDQLTWIQGRNKRRSRFLAKDKLRLSEHTEFSEWFIYQVMDLEGYFSYVFKRSLGKGKSESIIIKQSDYNRVMEMGKKRRVLEVRDLKNLIEKTALIFFAENGNRVEFKPGFTGRGTLVVYYTGQTQPIHIRGLQCARGNPDGRDPFLPPDEDSEDGSSGGSSGS